MSRPHKNQGFSLVELVSVLVIVGVLAVVAIPRLAGGDAYRAQGFLDETASAARYAQRLAAASGCAVQFNVDGNGYDLQHEEPCQSDRFGDKPVRHPAGSESFTAGTPADVVLTVTGATTIVFDALGRPNAASQITISATGFSGSFTVHPETGYVETL